MFISVQRCVIESTHMQLSNASFAFFAIARKLFYWLIRLTFVRRPHSLHRVHILHSSTASHIKVVEKREEVWKRENVDGLLPSRRKANSLRIWWISIYWFIRTAFVSVLVCVVILSSVELWRCPVNLIAFWLTATKKKIYTHKYYRHSAIAMY